VRLQDILEGYGNRNQIEHVFLQLVDRRLITTGKETNTEDIFVSISHEALIRNWARFQDWIDQNRDNIRIERRLMDAAKEWKRLNRDPELLYSGGKLIEAEEWLSRLQIPIPPSSEEFLNASKQAHVDKLKSVRRRNSIMVFISMIATIGMIAALYLWVQSKRQAIISQSGELAAQSAVAIESQPDLAMLLSIQAISLNDNWKTRDSLYAAIQKNSLIRQFLYGHSTWGKVVLSPNNDTMATADYNGIIIIWDLSEEYITKKFELESLAYIQDVIYSKDGSKLVYAGCEILSPEKRCKQTTIVVFDINSRRTIKLPVHETDLDVEQLVFNNFEPILTAVFFQPFEEEKIIQQWNIESWEGISKKIIAYPESAKWNSPGKISPDGHTLVGYSQDEGVYYFLDLTTDEIHKSIDKIPWANKYSINPTENTLAVGYGGVISIINFDSGEIITHLNLESGSEVKALEFSPDGKKLVFADSDGVITVWDLKSERSIKLHNNLNNDSLDVWDIIYSSDGKTFLTIDRENTITLWDSVSFTLLSNFSVGATSSSFIDDVVILPDDKSILIFYRNGKIISLNPYIINPLESHYSGHEKSVLGLAFHPDGTLISNDENTIRFWDISSIPPGIFSLTVNDLMRTGIELTPDGKLIVAGIGNDLYVWEYSSRQLYYPPMKGHSKFVTALAISPDGKIIASGGEDSKIFLWDSKTGKQIGNSLEGHIGPIYHIAFSPDSELIVSSGLDGTIRFWSTKTQKEIREPINTGLSYLNSNFWMSPTENTIIYETGDYLMIWDLNTEMPFSRPIPGTSYFNSVSIDPTGETLVVPVYENKYLSGAKFVNVKSGQIYQQAFPIINGNVNKAAFSSDGKLLALGSSTGYIQIWNLDTRNWVKFACEKIRRNLSKSEWETYLTGQPYQSTCPQYPGGK
jgi:WD40 repeat protein